MVTLITDGRKDQMSNVICFYHEYDDYGCFSNWYQTEFKYGRETFSSVEQYMMYHKAAMFHEWEILEKIMATKDPAEIKKLGRSYMKHFNPYVWDKTSYTIVKRGIRAKFEQNPELREVLLETDNCILAEASLRDIRWGIGVADDDVARYDVSKWNGRNLLGRALMEVREEFRRIGEKSPIEYVDAFDADFPEWHMTPGELKRNPIFYNTIHAYADTLPGDYEKNCFYNDGPIYMWEISMRTNMGGGLPAAGFWEMKQELFDILRYQR